MTAPARVYHRGPSGEPTTAADPLCPNAAFKSGTPCRVEYDDREPDARGRRRFTVWWDQPWSDVHVRRAQCYHAVPTEHFTATALAAEIESTP